MLLDLNIFVCLRVGNGGICLFVEGLALMCISIKVSFCLNTVASVAMDQVVSRNNFSLLVIIL